MTFPTIGLIGGGHISQLLTARAHSLGIRVNVLAANPVASFAHSSTHTIGDENNLEILTEFAGSCDLIVFESANASQSLIKTLAASNINVYPKPDLNDAIAAINDGAPSVSDITEMFTIAVARSPHNQAAIWTVSSLEQKVGEREITITSAPQISHRQHLRAQRFFLEIAEKIKLVGVMEAKFGFIDDEVSLIELTYGPQGLNSWSIEGAKTDVYEQHLRAILDLPLGSTESTYPYAVTATIYTSKNADLYRPYLHLMARNPALKFHQYGYSDRDTQPYLHLTLTGTDVDNLMAEIGHACDYISGEVDE